MHRRRPRDRRGIRVGELTRRHRGRGAARRGTISLLPHIGFQQVAILKPPPLMRQPGLRSGGWVALRGWRSVAVAGGYGWRGRTVRTRTMWSRNSAMKFLRKSVVDSSGALAAAGEDFGGEADVGLGRGHLAGVAEAQHRAQALLGDGGADLADGCADHAGGDVVEGVLAPGPRGPVDGVLQRAGDRAVVLRGDEQDGVGPADRVLERGGLGRVVRVVVLAVERQVPDRDLGELEVLGGQVDQDLGEFAVDGGGREASDEVADLVPGHVLPFTEGMRWWNIGGADRVRPAWSRRRSPS